jgi:tetratricopeptide (TPR) repeat protein
VDQGNGRYAAFLSYSHKDAAAARWLHRRLETYRIPKRLVGAEGEWGPVPARLTPIFRDREELPAAGDLSERVRAALALSDNLVILCSPAAAASPWVAKEIAAFRELHPGRPIFAAIVEGDPPLCFPPSLAAGGAEPLAADLRPDRDGRRLGFLKLVAGLSGTRLDALVQRDAQRRLRRVTAVTGVALAAMLIMAVLTGLALSERREAQRQRAEAEGLVEFMLTDLRDRLRTVGRLDVMQAVNARALQRYGGPAQLNRLSPDALSRRARILQAIGEDELTLGNIANAESVFRNAYRATAEQLSRDPHDLKRQLDHARSEYWIGRVHEVRREWPQAQRQYLRFAMFADRLAEAAPRNPDYMTEVAWSRIDLGNVQLNGIHNPPAAQRLYHVAISWFARAAQARPKDASAARVLANAYGWLADSYLAQRAYNLSLEARVQQYRIVEQLHREHPRDANHVFALALAQRALASALASTGQRDRARAELSQAAASSRQLAVTDPSNGEWQLLKAFVGCDLLFGKLAPPPRETRAQIVADVKSATVALLATGNPRVGEFANCQRALGGIVS